MSEPTHLPRLYDEKEVTRLLKRATELQREEPVRAAGGGGLSLEHGQPSLLGRSLTWQGETANKTRSLLRPPQACPPAYLLPRPKRRRRGRLLSCSPPTAAVLAVFAAARALSSAFRARMAAMRSPSGTSSGTSGVAS